MSDLISRQAAIDALCKVGCGSGYCGISCDDVKAIEQLPSLHPQRTGRQMMGAEKTLVNVNKGQDAYSVIGNYILNHVTAIEDMIAVIQINGVIIKELYMVDVDADGYFYWKSDWWEGEEDVALLDFFPVSDAEAIPAADVVPVRLGEWLDGYKMQTCSLCKCRGKKSWTFCPHCGARMIYGERKE